MVKTTRLFSRSMGQWLMALLLVMLSSLAARAAEAYAVYKSLNKTLTFYYDDLRSTRTGLIYDLNTGENEPSWYNDGTNASVRRVVFDPSFAGARPTTTYAWFADMSQLQAVSDAKYLNTSNVTNMMAMFAGCTSLTSLDLTGFNTANVQDMGYMFGECSNLTNITVGSGWTTAAVTSSYDMFLDCTSLVGGKGTTYNANHTDKAYARIDGGPSKPGYLSGTESYVVLEGTTLTFYCDGQRTSRPGTSYDLNSEEINNGIPEWYVSSITTDSVSPVTQAVFDPSFADARPTLTMGWFTEMPNLQNITGLEYLNTEAVTNMYHMFSFSGITSLDLSHFNTANVTDMSYMFYECFNLTSLDLSHFNTANVTKMSGLCGSCPNLTNLDLSSFNTAKVTDMTQMFVWDKRLKTIYVGQGWTTAAVTHSEMMFEQCFELVGGKGTTYNSSHVDKAYAHIDGGTSNPGYFTDNSPEAYACYTSSNTTLTFYYDTLRSSRTGTTYSLNTGTINPRWYTDGTNANVTRVVFDASFAAARPTTTNRWFYGMTKLTTITGRNYLNTSEVTDMEYMFLGCSSLTSLDLSNFNTSKVTDMQYMFYDCSSLTSLNLSSFNTSNVTKMGSMFQDCSGLTSLNVSSFNTSNVTWMSGIFAGCSGLTSLNLSNFNTANVTSMLNMFAYCSSLTSLNVSSFNTSNVTEMGFMFSNCSSLTSLDLSSFNTSNVTYMGYMFQDCSALTSLDLSSFNTSKATYMGDMFHGCTGLTSLDLSSFNTSKVTNMGYMFQDCSSLQTVYVDSSWSTAAVASSYNMFSNCTSLVGGQGTTYSSSHVDAAYAHIDGGPSNPGYLTDINPPTEPEPYACYTPSNTTLTFYYDKLRSSRPTTTYGLYESSVPWYSDGTYSSVTHVVFDPSFADVRVEEARQWFYRMENLQSITGMEYFDTHYVSSLYQLFYGCSRLTNVDVSHFRTLNVTDMRQMFYGCSSLTSLDLSSWSTPVLRRTNDMFCRCTNLTTIYVGDGWNTEGVTTTNSAYMFYGCTNLIGGQGTTYDASHVDAAYAHIDGGPSNPGYLTASFMRGDVNNDGQVKISDVTALINYLLSGDTSGINLQAADCNQNGEIKIGDVTALINYLLSGTW